MRRQSIIWVLVALLGNLEDSFQLQADADEDDPTFQVGEPLSLAEMLAASERPIIPGDKEKILKVFESAETNSGKIKMENLKRNPFAMGRSGIASLETHWPDGIVYYELDQKFTKSERELIADAMNHISEHSCVRFKERNGQEKFVRIIEGKGCSAYLPSFGRKMTKINLQRSANCIQFYIILHELLHSIGMIHEMSRPDRDEYVVIHWDNMKTDNGTASNYYKDSNVGDIPLRQCEGEAGPNNDLQNCNSGHFTTACGLKYDYHSVMHYNERLFAKNPWKPVITAIQPNKTELGNEKLSELDIKKLQCLYQCDGAEYSHCGGYFHKPDGEFKSDGSNGCDWLLKAPKRNKIILDFSGLPSDLTCTEAYIEIYYGRSASGVPFATYCSINVSEPIHTEAKYLFIKMHMPEGAIRKGHTNGSWRSEEVTCCNQLVVEWPGQGRSMHWNFTKIKELEDGSPVYKNKYGLYISVHSPDFGPNYWTINKDYKSNSISRKNDRWGLCPDVNSAWSYYTLAGWKEDKDAVVRCFNCQKHPASPECAPSCSNNLKVTSKNQAVLQSWRKDLLGDYTIFGDVPVRNNMNVYKHERNSFCLYYDCNNWIFNWCAEVSKSPSCSYFIHSSESNIETCPTYTGITWNQEIEVSALNQLKSGEIMSENFPNEYPKESDKTWQLEVPMGSTLELKFEEFQLEKFFYDYVKVIDSDGVTELGKYCGEEIPPTLVSSGNKLKIEFHSDNSYQRKGFKATWTEQN